MTWIIFLLIGIASATALNPDYVADKVIAGMNTQLAAHGSQWFSLPGFEISFNNRNESKWKFVNGELTSIGNVDRDPEQVGPEIVYFSSDRGSPSVVINVNIADVAVTYNFICEDFFVISGFTYAITRTVPTQATLLVDVSNCRGSVRRATSSFSYEEDGSDFSKITPFDQYAKQCLIRSYTTVGDYADRINSQFQKDYGPAVEKMLFTALENTLNNLNLCAQ